MNKTLEVLICFTVIDNPLVFFFLSQVHLDFSFKTVHRIVVLNNLQRVVFEMIFLKDQRLASKSEIAVCTTDGRSMLTDFR